MRTLNKVIDELNIWDTCDKYPKSFYDDEVIRDALFYLKEYRWVVENCAEALAEKYPSENNPLTWDELRIMEGKPIWVEGSWEIIDSCYEEYFSTDTGGIYYRKNDECHGDYGKDWQAYRREKR